VLGYVNFAVLDWWGIEVLDGTVNDGILMILMGQSGWGWVSVQRFQISFCNIGIKKEMPLKQDIVISSNR
jgi:hypothetical protein